MYSFPEQNVRLYGLGAFSAPEKVVHEHRFNMISDNMRFDPSFFHFFLCWALPSMLLLRNEDLLHRFAFLWFIGPVA